MPITLASIKSSLDSLRPKRRWAAPQGYKEVLQLCLPLTASSIAASAMMFTDRIFLARHSIEAIAAALPAGVMKFAITSVFMGIVAYTGIFVSQYTGAGKPERASASLWQGLYLSVFFGLLHYLLLLDPDGLFALAGHDPEIRRLEAAYFSVLVWGAPVELFMIAMSAFLSSMGKARIVMWVSLSGTALNIPLDYLLIFGVEGCIPPMGVFGAAAATVFSWVFNFAILSYFIFNRSMEKSHRTRSGHAVDWPLMWRIVRFGYPNGIQFFMEVFAFAFFAFAVGWLGSFYLASNNIVFSIEALSFFPMVGLGQAVSILVGQAIGRGRPVDGERVAVSGIVISTSFVFCMLFCFLMFPGPILRAFLPPGLDPEYAAGVVSLGTDLLKFVVVYSLFDGLYLCCFGAVKGAGDVWYPLWAMTFWGVFGLILPILVLFRLDLANIYSMWACMVFYVLALTMTGAHRFLTRKWMKKKVIEKTALEG